MGSNRSQNYTAPSYGEMVLEQQFQQYLVSCFEKKLTIDKRIIPGCHIIVPVETLDLFKCVTDAIKAGASASELKDNLLGGGGGTVITADKATATTLIEAILDGADAADATCVALLGRLCEALPTKATEVVTP